MQALSVLCLDIQLVVHMAYKGKVVVVLDSVVYEKKMDELLMVPAYREVIKAPMALRSIRLRFY